MQRPSLSDPRSNAPHRAATTVIRTLSAVLLVGGIGLAAAAPAAASPASHELDRVVPDMNQERYWNNHLSTDAYTVSCTKYGNDGGFIDAQYDAAVISDGVKVRVYPDLRQSGAFTAVGATNPNNGRPYAAPHSHVMKCTFTDVPPTTPVQPGDRVAIVTVDGDWECDETTVAIVITTTTTPYVRVGGEWVLDTDNAEVVVTEGVRDLTDDEFTECETTETPQTPETPEIPKTPATPVTPETPETTAVDALTPVAPGPLTSPATVTSAAEAPVVALAAPVAPTPAPTADPVQAPTADPVQEPLPSTGSTSGVLAALAALLTLSGFGLRRIGQSGTAGHSIG